MDRINTVGPERSPDLLPGVHFLCRLFWGPDILLCREMAGGGFTAAFSPLRILLPNEACAAADAFGAHLDVRPDPEDLCRDLQITYARLFLGAGQGLSAPPYQSCYLASDAPLMGLPAVRMRERLAAAGLSIAGQGNEPPDHLAVELEYLYFLLSKVREDKSAHAQWADRAAEFANSELCGWLPLFSDRLAGIPEAEPYNYAAVLARGLACLIAGGQ